MSAPPAHGTTAAPISRKGAGANRHSTPIRGSVPGPRVWGGGLFPVSADWGPCPGTAGRRVGPLDSGGVGVLGLVWLLQLLPQTEQRRRKTHSFVAQLIQDQQQMNRVDRPLLNMGSNSTDCWLQPEHWLTTDV